MVVKQISDIPALFHLPGIYRGWKFSLASKTRCMCEFCYLFICFYSKNSISSNDLLLGFHNPLIPGSTSKRMSDWTEIPVRHRCQDQKSETYWKQQGTMLARP